MAKKEEKIKGLIGIVKPRIIKGWCFDINNEMPVNVELWLDGEKVASAAAKDPRPGLKANGTHESGFCGYEFKVAQSINKNTRIIVKAGEGKTPIKKSLRAKRQQNTLLPAKQFEKPALLPTKDGYFFVHIPKTAGTSFRMMLYEVFEQKEIFPNLDDIQKNNNSYPPISYLWVKWKAEQRPFIRLVGGHFLLKTDNIFEHAPNILVFLRRPIDRAISTLFHLKKHHPEFENDSLDEIYEKAPEQFIDTQVRFMAGAPYSKTLDENDLNLALTNLMKSAFIGITERFDDSIQYLEHKFSWKFSEKLSENINKSKKPRLVSDQLMQKIKNVNQLDEKLYQFGLDLFETRFFEMEKQRLMK